MSIKQRTKSLKSRASSLSDTFFQLKVLNNNVASRDSFTPFAQKAGIDIVPKAIEVLQINIGKLCNQSCAHCHVDAGPDRKDENMNKTTLSKCLEIIENYNIPAVDITGGAPELNPNFRWFVRSCSNLGVKVINRCNLTIIRSNPKFYDLPQFFAENGVHIISSLPYFSKVRTDRQRGEGVFDDSIEALKDLNNVGYGLDGSGLTLDLVHNPSGAYLPGDQHSLEREFKSQLLRRYGIHFNNLFAITNLPISRFLEYLIETGNYESYMQELIDAFNPCTLEGLMCTYTLSVSWDGYIYDCDFNQMLDLKIDSESQHIDRFDFDIIMSRKVKVNQHCYGCTAGSGSSCGGEIV